MFAVSADFQNAYESGAEQDILLTFADGSTIGKSDISITSGGLTITEYMNPDEDYTIGTASMAELKATLLNKNGKFNSFNFAQTFLLQFGVMVNGAFEYIPLGKWIGTRPEKVKTNIIEFTAQDCMKVLEKSAQDMLEGLDYPTTISNIYFYVQDESKLGTYVAVNFSSPVNWVKPVKKHHFRSTDYTYREVTSMVAEATGGYSRIEYSNATAGARHRIKPFETVDYTVGRKGRFALSVSDFPTPRIDRLEVYTSYSDKLVTSGTGNNVYVISDNPLLYAENDDDTAELQPYVDALYGVLSALPEYYPASLRAVGVPWLECGDIITVIDDNNEELVFPIFTKTMTWSGSWMMELENTGGQARQIAPAEQRELENLKKNMFQTDDLWTEIDSYLNTEEGAASITSAVGGKFVEKALETVYSTPSGVTYGFEKTSDGYYTSTNAGIDDSFSYGKLTFNSLEAQTITLQCINHGENNYDYGLISALNSNLSQSNEADTANVLYDFSGESSAEPVVISLDIPAGESFITFKYIKDASVNSESDYFKIKAAGGGYATTAEVSAIIKQEISAFESSITLSAAANGNTGSFTLKSGEAILSVANITFSGLVTFNDLATEGSTMINGSNITTGKINASLVDTSDLIVENVWLKSSIASDTKVLTSEALSSTNLTVRLGVQEDKGWAQYLELYGTVVYLGRPGYIPSSDDNALMFDMANRGVYPKTRGKWVLGGADSYFDSVFVQNAYVKLDVVFSPGTDNESTLWVSSTGKLRFTDKNGDNHTIVDV